MFTVHTTHINVGRWLCRHPTHLGTDPQNHVISFNLPSARSLFDPCWIELLLGAGTRGDILRLGAERKRMGKIVCGESAKLYIILVNTTFIYKRKKNLRYLQIKLRLSPSALLRVNFIRAEISLGGGGGSRVRSFRQEPGHSSGSKASNTCGQKVVSSINHLPGLSDFQIPEKVVKSPQRYARL